MIKFIKAFFSSKVNLGANLETHLSDEQVEKNLELMLLKKETIAKNKASKLAKEKHDKEIAEMIQKDHYRKAILLKKATVNNVKPSGPTSKSGNNVKPSGDQSNIPPLWNKARQNSVKPNNSKKEYGILNKLESEVERLSKEIRSNKLVTVYEFKKQQKNTPSGYDFKVEYEIIKQLEHDMVGKEGLELKRYKNEIFSWRNAILCNVMCDNVLMGRARLAPVPYNGQNFCTNGEDFSALVDNESHRKKVQKLLQNAKNDNEKKKILKDSEIEIKKIDDLFLQELKEDLKEFEENMEKDGWKTLGPDAPIVYK